MAITKIELIETPDVNKPTPGFTTTAGTVADGFLVKMGGKDFKTVFVATNLAAAEGTITVKVGDSKRAAAEDSVVTIPANSSVLFTLDSGYYERFTGDEKGYVKMMPSATTVKIAVAELK